MKASKTGGFSWKDMQGKAHQFLGENFWGDMNQLMPKLGPSVDLYKTSSEIIAVVEVPGTSSQNRIGIKIRGNKLLIHGNIPWNYPISEDDILQKERFTGEFKREVELPYPVSPNAEVEALFINGLIEIHIPRDQCQEEKDVEIKYNNI